MTGSPGLVQGEAMQLSAEQIEYHRDTQNAAASGDVKVTYAQSAAPTARRLRPWAEADRCT